MPLLPYFVLLGAKDATSISLIRRLLELGANPHALLANGKRLSDQLKITYKNFDFNNLEDRSAKYAKNIKAIFELFTEKGVYGQQQ